MTTVVHRGAAAVHYYVRNPEWKQRKKINFNFLANHLLMYVKTYTQVLFVLVTSVYHSNKSAQCLYF